MSSYDIRNAAQIRLDEMIRKYKDRSRESNMMKEKYETDAEIYKNLMSLIDDLKLLKEMIDKQSKKGGKNGTKI